MFFFLSSFAVERIGERLLLLEVLIKLIAKKYIFKLVWFLETFVYTWIKDKGGVKGKHFFKNF